MLRSLIFTCLAAVCMVASTAQFNSLLAVGTGGLTDPYSDFFGKTDTLPLIRDRMGDFLSDPNRNPFDLRDPQIIQQNVDYDPKTNSFIVDERLDSNTRYRPSTEYSFDEYFKMRNQNEDRRYLRQLSQLGRVKAGDDPVVPYKDRISKSIVDRLFCGSEINVRPQGNIDLTFGGDYQKIANPVLTERQQRQGGFDFDMNIQLNVIGTIGQKLKLTFNYNTQATFDFDRQVKVQFLSDTECSEDDILKKVEAGNVSFPLRSSLITGRQNLFGFRTDLQFGRLKVSAVASQSQTQRKEIQIQGGAQLQEFEVNADNYDENRHFFISHYNRSVYERSLQNIPQINSLFNITKLEVWITNDRNVTEGVRDVVAFADLGETEPDVMLDASRIVGATERGTDLFGKRLPDRNANTLYSDLQNNSGVRGLPTCINTLQNTFGMNDGEDFSKVRGRKLAPTEYTFHPQLGFLSLNLQVKPTDVIGIAYQYTYNGKTYQVGEFAQDLPIDADTLNVMYLKMLKGVRTRVDLPIWDLMMKNVYSLGAYQVNPEDFRLDIYYQDPGGGVKRFLPDGPIASKPLMAILNLDNLNRALDPIPDGQFDFVPGLTILPANGRVILPVLEPFGSYLDKQFWSDPTNSATRHPLAQKYVYNQLYDSTITIARQFPEFNRFVIKGRYKSSVSSEISLGGFNIPRGSVVVSAGGATLAEGTDYTIDYNLGRIKILNESYLNSGQPIRVAFEDNSQFGFNRQSFFGTRLDYYINDKFNIGGTFLHLLERPFTQKVNYGDDPMSNSIYGFDVQYSSDAPWLTRLVDKLPLLSTKAPSTISFTGEFAHLLPGSPKIINMGTDEGSGGTIYVDDFEGSGANFNLTVPSLNWVLASTPRTSLFTESTLSNDLDYNKNRARMFWYIMDPDIINRADNASDDDKKSVYVKQFRLQDLFRNLQPQANENNLLRTFDLAYYPKERGPYNFSTDNIDPTTGEFTDPEKRWGGVMRSLQNNDFEANNIEFLEVWVMSPFKEGKGGQGGHLYIELGDVSEDILRDSRLFFENGLTDPAAGQRNDTTTWSQIPRIQAVTNAFDNDPDIRNLQDIGLDGFDDEGEKRKFAPFLDSLAAKLGVNNPVYQKSAADPSGDNFRYFRDEYFNENTPPTGINGIIWRYSQYNNPQGNSSQEPDNTNQTLSTSTNQPDSEDINRDNTLNEEEAFYQYKIPIRPVGVGNDEIGTSAFMTDSVGIQYDGLNGPETVYFYQYKIPIDQYTDVVGNMQGFRSIRFARMYMTGFEDETIMRFARFDLIRNQWRRYLRSLALPGVYIPSETSNETSFDVNAVNINENSQKTPFPYVLPPGVQREQAIGTLGNAQQNEQAMSMNICNLQDGDARGAYKIVNMDMRVYKRMRMFVHAEDVLAAGAANNPGDLSLFVRIGSDFENNYYEYEVPLTMSSNIGSATPTDVWLEENNIDLPLELLRNIKIRRNAANAALSVIYEESDPDNANNSIKIIGNPELGLVKSMMVGVRNRRDDGLARCVEVWVNELRLTGFDERGGTAGLGRLDMQLADFGNITLSGSYRTIGFGSIEQRVNQRSRERFMQYDATGSFMLDRFLPKAWKVRLPLFAQYSQEIRTPEYDPYQLDIPLKTLLESTLDGGLRDSLRKQAQSTRTISSFNFTNVRKERTAKYPALPFDISNFTFTYAQTQNIVATPIIEREERKENRGLIDYTYAPPMKPLFPFKKLLGKPNKWLALIQDFNIRPLPNSIGVRNELVRRFGETKYRFADDANNIWYDKKFSWDRSYNLQWDLTQSLKINFTATNNGVVDEPYGRIDSREKQDTILANLQKFGRNKTYQHNLNVAYTLPFKKIPILDFIDVRAQYSTNFNWAVASLNTDSLGNIIGNSQNRQINADFAFDKLYNKSKYLKKISTPAPPVKIDPKGKQTPPPITDPNKKSLDDKKGKDEKKKNKEPSRAARMFIRPLLILQRGRITYTEDFTTILPGFVSTHTLLGQSKDFSKPGFDFAFGMQPTTQWLDDASTKGWITPNIFQNQQFQQTHRIDYSGKLNLSPFTDFNIEVDINKTLTESYSESFKVDTFGGDYRHLNPMRIGTVTMSYLPIRSMTDSEGSYGKNSSSNFDLFSNNRLIISQRLGTGIHDDTTRNGGYTEGYGRFQQDVLVNAFISAYNGKDARTMTLINDVRNLLPAPNWRVTYNGLQKLKFFKKFLTSFSLTHAYKSTLTVNKFATDLDYAEDPTQKDENSSNFYATFEVPDILISEQFNPLIGIDMRFKNDLSARFNYKSSRNLSMSFNDYTLASTTSEEITLGMGFRLKNRKPKDLFKSQKQIDKEKAEPKKPKKTNENEFYFDFGKTIPKHEWNFQFDFSYRDDKTVNHILDQRTSQATRGMKTIRIAPSIDYIINTRLTIRAFFDYARTIPAVSNAFPITNMKGGVTLRFSLSQ
jgi:cell surface protein SprA